jgi:hypothetical protein
MFKLNCNHFPFLVRTTVPDLAVHGCIVRTPGVSMESLQLWFSQLIRVVSSMSFANSLLFGLEVLEALGALAVV